MRLKHGIFGLALLVASPVYSQEPASPPILVPTESQAKAATLSAEFLERYAYKPVKLDDALSLKVMNKYIKSLDPDRMLFMQSDIDEFAANSTKLDDGIAEQDLEIPFSIFHIYTQRVVDRMTYARNLLKGNFDFSTNEEFEINREDAAWAKTEKDSEELWRKRVKNDWLRLKLAGQADATIRTTLDKRYKNMLDRVYSYKTEDVFQTLMAAYTTAVDPHTDYFSPATSDEFDISMKLSLVGIGAVLQERDGYTTIRELVAGGPAQLSGKLAVGDRITGVGQGADGTIQEVVGTRLDEVVKMIRGSENSIVRLDILPADAGESGGHRIISLVRDKVSLEKQAAQKTVLSLEKEGLTSKIGVITLPTFYEDFDARRNGDKDYRSASRDVAKLLGELKKEEVDGVLIDLRNNGGGSLTEAIDLTGLFIGKGPVVQQRNAQGKIEVESDDDPAPAWKGPLGVLINRGSASASEIFAAAIQDYGRGVVIGEPSFGKGTVQTVVDLDRVAGNEKPELGQLKLTIAQFFRVDGGTTQLRGVTPDVALPGILDPKLLGESSYDNALPWTEIKPAKYKAAGDIKPLIPQLESRHSVRADNDPDYKRFLEDVADLKAQREKKTLSLNEVERRKELDATAARMKARAAEGDPLLPDQDDGLQANERSLSANLALENAHKNAKDVLQNEAAAIVGDVADLKKRRDN
ncbi:carboxy terminal-processing peptidase [Agrobacterium larrymoorei]|uniref:carboxy terminal-processing peptidase n=1 Tax=Agrobacterium larrymoorei TaxID=160699 RepID=UPI001572E853|nr:carboxy terminal-processing peptidase [Agrobacterium larrymoorei]NTJ41920.1 carboxy terminal-processing peptidase [Agrobacterium larrymoorei]